MPSSETLTRLLTSKSALAESKIERAARAPLAAGEALLKVDRVAITTNNVTYAVFGDAMQYWSFFPTGQEGWGHMPVWGFADVVESTVQGVEPGERFYGYFPIASHLRVSPARVSARGFYDGAEHRLSLVSAYNHYTRCSSDPYYDKQYENYQMLTRPLIITSFFAADFLADNSFFGAEQLLVSSASSKTAYGTAFCLQGTSGVELVGLTSARNKAFTEALGCYQRVITYEELEQQPASTRTVYLDFAGDTSLRERVHRHFGDALVYDCVAGSAQNTDPSHLRVPGLPGPEPKLYFAPVQIAKRNKEWGHDQVNKRFGEAQRAFIQRVSDPKNPWMKLVEHHGLEGAAALIQNMVAGKINPSDGHVVAL
ncbi:MAG TPA: DUF2855 family protein [Polyangiales bacterium]|nr:DUF2855 family protein [Polyangiales bacterium]